MDIWQYIYLENIQIVPLYFSAVRPVVERSGTLIMVDDERMRLKEGEVPQMKSVRFRTLGCYPLTGAVESEADTLPEIIQEMLLATSSERQGRMIDHDEAGSMERKARRLFLRQFLNLWSLSNVSSIRLNQPRHSGVFKQHEQKDLLRF